MNGIILINKQKDYTSHDVVAIVKKLSKEKVGHTGTLDPNATGVLPLLIGGATQISKYLINHDKVYQAILKLGIKTDTADSTGTIIEQTEVNSSICTTKKIKNALNSFIGKQEQYPPMYSAIKVNGKKLYEYARKGEIVNVNSRNIEIYEICLDNIDEEEMEITFTINCSKGTYIRTVCEQIAEKLNTIGCMKELRRIQVGEFNIKDCITIEELKTNIEEPEFINSNIIKIEDLFKNKAQIILDYKKLELFLNGVKLTVELNNDIYKIYDNKNKFIGIGVVKDNLLKRDVII